jgi:hypothetical protein
MKRIRERLQLVRSLLIPLIFYIGLLAVSYTQAAETTNSTIAIMIALLPIIPAIFLAVGLVKAINQLDELERKIILEAAAVSFMITFLGMLALGLLNQVGISTPNPIYISLLMAVLLIASKFIGNWKHK